MHPEELNPEVRIRPSIPECCPCRCFDLLGGDWSANAVTTEFEHGPASDTAPDPGAFETRDSVLPVDDQVHLHYGSSWPSDIPTGIGGTRTDCRPNIGSAVVAASKSSNTQVT